jgi:EAL domain-containing protein (putative c-di-GMP-specific phosphodiesterase class I)
MHYPALQEYLSRLHAGQTSSKLWVDMQGRALGSYFKATLTSAFQTIRSGNGDDTGEVVAYEAYARTHASDDQGLNIWKLLDYAASDDESVELDRLCRLLHTVNFFRQPEAAKRNLYLSVHSRLLAAVAGNHGAAFRRILDALELPYQNIVLQLPLITPSQRWVLTHVAENYRRNGFRIGVNAANLEQASDLMDRIRPYSIKIDVSQANDPKIQNSLLQRAERQSCKLIFKRIEREDKYRALQNDHTEATPYFVQGFLFDIPNASLVLAETSLHHLQRYSLASASGHICA